MKNQSFYLKLSGAVITTVSAAATLILNLSYAGPLAAGLIAAAVLLVKNAEKTSRKTGRTDRMKASLKGFRPGAELLLVSSGLVMYSPPVYVAVSVLGFLGFSEIFSKSSDVEEFFGQEVRIGLLILAVLGHAVNPYILFYGLLALGSVASVDSVYMLFKSFESRV